MRYNVVLRSLTRTHEGTTEMPNSATLSIGRAQHRFLVRETAVILGAAVTLPLLVHLIPATSVPWGARLLPMFLAPLLGVMMYRLHVGLVPALLAPALNALLTGSPTPLLAGLLTFELVIFTLAVNLLLKRWPRLWLAGPAGYLIAKMISASAVALLPALEALQPAVRFAIGSVETAVPGLLIMTAVTLLALHFRPDSPSETA